MGPLNEPKQPRKPRKDKGTPRGAGRGNQQGLCRKCTGNGFHYLTCPTLRLNK